MYPIFLCLFLQGTRILWFREVNRLARGAQLSERQAHLKPRLFAPHSTPGQDGDHEVSGSPQRRSPQGTPLTLALRGRPRVASLTPTNRLTLCRWPVSPARLRSRGGAGRGGPPGRPGAGAGPLGAGAGPPRAGGRKYPPARFRGSAGFACAQLHHGTAAADSRAVLRCAVPLFLAGLRGDSGGAASAGAWRTRAEGRASKGRRDRKSREIPGAARRGLGQADREPG